jgi:hypothetical protein
MPAATAGFANRKAEGTRPRDSWISTLAWLMDSAIPIGRWSIGLDGLLGLVPGFGDFAGTVISLVIVARAAAAGMPQIALTRMLANVAIDSLLGLIPVVGDVFDFAYKANIRNLRIYEEYLHGSTSTIRHWSFFVVLTLVLIAILAVPVLLVLLIVQAV